MIVAGAMDFLVKNLEEHLHLEVSVRKSVTKGDTFTTARRIAQLSRTKKLTAVRSAKLLGIDVSGGAHRSTKVQRLRVKTLAERVPRIRAMR